MKKYVAGFMLVIGSITMIGCGGDEENIIQEQTISIGGVTNGLCYADTASCKAVISLVAADGVENLTVANGAFQFQDKLKEGESYAVTIVSDPLDRTCTIENSSGVAQGSNITNLTITCAF